MADNVNHPAHYQTYIDGLETIDMIYARRQSSISNGRSRSERRRTKGMIKTLAQTGDKSVGESIRDLRTARGLSIRELATEAGLSSAAISRWESGKRIPSVESFNKVMAALNAELTVVAK